MSKKIRVVAFGHSFVFFSSVIQYLFWFELQALCFVNFSCTDRRTSNMKNKHLQCADFVVSFNDCMYPTLNPGVANRKLNLKYIFAKYGKLGSTFNFARKL